MGFLSKQDFKGEVFGPNLSSLDILLKVTAVAVKKLEQEKKLKKQRMMGAFNSKKEETKAYPVNQSISKEETWVAEKSTSKKPLVATLKKEKLMVKEPKKALKSCNGACVPTPFLPKKPRGWQPKKEKGIISEERVMTSKKNGLKRKFCDVDWGLELNNSEMRKSMIKRQNKKLEPNTTTTTHDWSEEFEKKIEKVDLVIERKLFKSDDVDNDIDDDDWDLATKNNFDKCKGLMKKQKKNLVRNTTTTHDLPEEFKKKIETLGGIKVELVIEKKLFKSDTIQGENRLSMPLKQIRSNFLEDDEVKRLERDETLTVSLIDTKLQERDICLRRWNMKTSKWYVLKTQWIKIVRDNKLRIGDVIQVWSFRDENNNLHLALVLVEIGLREINGEDSNGSGCSKNGFFHGESSSGNSGVSSGFN
ncbi:hypothetical protein M0R45_034648 [Rubus argutus]|uniref:TF-B3 domain-containing protein n=1 Tax=Rubus argutus TaxID=59490 RepID=A0AAW1VRR7_RUBAR